MRNLHVAIWQVNTLAMQYLDIHSRLAYLYKTVDQTYTNLRALPKHKHKLKGIFVVPEYYFAKQAVGGHHQLTEERHLSQEEEKDIASSLACLSQLYPGLLIIPGTIAWKKSLIEETSIDGDHLIFDQRLYHCDAITSTESTDCHSVYAYLNGKQVYADHREDGTQRTAKITPPTFELDGIRFGIEIFLDHAYGTLNTPVDVHIILSTCVRRNGGKGKYVIYASNRASDSGAWKAEKGKYLKLNSHVANQIMDYDMQTS